MTDDAFAALETALESDGPAAALDRLIDVLRAEKNYHKLFDALLLKQRFEMGVPLASPTSFEDVPAEQRSEFEQSYIDAARHVGELLLAEGEIPQAWIYFRTIQEVQPMVDAIEAMPVPQEYDEESEQIINIALFEGVHPLKGVEMMLKGHGTCPTITALDQKWHELSSEDHTNIARRMVHELYGDLTQNVRYNVEQKLQGVSFPDSLRELMEGRDWLFEGGNYHIDVSHLNSVVRLARHLDDSCPELQQAIELAEYGSHLTEQLQYGSEPPFEEYYTAHIHFFNILAGEDHGKSVDYFRDILQREQEEQNRKLIAYVLVDLLMRVDRLDEAVAVAGQHLQDHEDPQGFSFAGLCHRSGNLDALQKAARENDDLIGFASAIVGQATESVEA